MALPKRTRNPILKLRWSALPTPQSHNCMLGVGQLDCTYGHLQSSTIMWPCLMMGYFWFLEKTAYSEPLVHSTVFALSVVTKKVLKSGWLHGLSHLNPSWIMTMMGRHLILIEWGWGDIDVFIFNFFTLTFLEVPPSFIFTILFVGFPNEAVVFTQHATPSSFRLFFLTA